MSLVTCKLLYLLCHRLLCGLWKTQLSVWEVGCSPAIKWNLTLGHLHPHGHLLMIRWAYQDSNRESTTKPYLQLHLPLQLYTHRLFRYCFSHKRPNSTCKQISMVCLNPGKTKLQHSSMKGSRAGREPGEPRLLRAHLPPGHVLNTLGAPLNGLLWVTTGKWQCLGAPLHTLGQGHICQLRKMCAAVAQLLPASKLPNVSDSAWQHTFRRVWLCRQRS